MKTMTCRDMGGPCDHAVTGATFEEIGKNCRAHVMEMMGKGDKPHMDAAMVMRNATPDQQQAMMADYRRKFDAAREV